MRSKVLTLTPSPTSFPSSSPSSLNVYTPFWKVSIILKPNIDTPLPTTHRPISQTNVLGKLNVLRKSLETDVIKHYYTFDLTSKPMHFGHTIKTLSWKIQTWSLVRKLLSDVHFYSPSHLRFRILCEVYLTAPPLLSNLDSKTGSFICFTFEPVRFIHVFIPSLNLIFRYSCLLFFLLFRGVSQKGALVLWNLPVMALVSSVL